jgi:hypothetical protein
MFEYQLAAFKKLIPYVNGWFSRPGLGIVGGF